MIRRRRMTISLVAVVAVGGGVAAIGWWGGSDDAPGGVDDRARSTSYRTEVVEERPAVDTASLEIIGGDQAVHLNVVTGSEVDVIGYEGEIYLRVDADGTVRRNERSPTRWLNEDRFADVEVPETARADATPEWTVVGAGGSFIWHDHRTHWMSADPPPGARSGDTVVEGVIPLIVDGEPVDVHVESKVV